MIQINFNPSRRDLRIFAGLLVAFSALVAWWVYGGTGSRSAAAAVIAAATLLAAVGWIYQPVLRWTYIGLTLAVSPIGWVVAHLLMAVVYYLVLTPIGLLMRLFGYDPMRRRFEPEAPTYWIPKHPQEGTERYFRQF